LFVEISAKCTVLGNKRVNSEGMTADRRRFIVGSDRVEGVKLVQTRSWCRREAGADAVATAGSAQYIN
jgi:hypothetical protein